MPLPNDERPKKIEIEGLRKSFGKIEVLKGISLEACQGDVVAILGASGSGKSTLLRCLNFLETPDAGTLSICGERITMPASAKGRMIQVDRQTLIRIRTRAAMVFQSFNLWSHMTVLENVIEAPIQVQRRPRAVCVAEAEAVLARVGLAEKRHTYPAMLSGGQQQRVAIARALAMRPEVLLFDEPTSALDPELVGEVLTVMRSLADEGRTMLVVTHEMGFARHVSSRTVFLHQGLVEEEGPSADVFANPKSERFRQFIRRIEV
ncbi:MAG: ATP-binding cassette domain-containing protein [Azospirillaceae bacterium]|nr:ATP-binding cassette domain-containing protein [Azospirillaceae bacterium]